jgi:glutaminyl-tRNA synthetase
MVDDELLFFCIREELNRTALRRMAVLSPLKLVITNYPEDHEEELDAENNPENASAGSRKISFGKELFIEAEDFSENPPKGWFRLSPGQEVRLKHAYYITCNEVVKDEAGNITEIRCSYDPASRGGWTEDGRKVKGTLHWVSARHCIPVELRLYDRLFTQADMSELEPGKTYKDYLNPASLEINKRCLAESSLANTNSGERFQFLRIGYFCTDYDSKPDSPIFNRITSLRDSWAKLSKKQ